MNNRRHLLLLCYCQTSPSQDTTPRPKFSRVLGFWWWKLAWQLGRQLGNKERPFMLEILASRLGWKLILLKSGAKMRFAVCGEYHLLALLPSEHFLGSYQ
jgi:hypothetical protein